MPISATTIIEHLYCPRYTYFENVLMIPQFEEKYFKVNKGREIHNNISKIKIDESNFNKPIEKRIFKHYISNDYLCGELDEIIFWKDETLSPVEYKFTFYKEDIFNTYKTQLIVYAILLEDSYKKNVNTAYIVYLRSNNKIEKVDITDKDKKSIKKIVDEIFSIIVNNTFPKPTKNINKCINCTYNNICVR